MWQSLMLCEWMSRSQISRRNFRATQILMDSLLTFIVLLFNVSKNTQVLTLPTIWINPRHFPFSPTLLLSLLWSILLFSLSLLLALFPDMFYLSSFHIKTRQICCMFIIDSHKTDWSNNAVSLEDMLTIQVKDGICIKLLQCLRVPRCSWEWH